MLRFFELLPSFASDCNFNISPLFFFFSKNCVLCAILWHRWRRKETSKPSYIRGQLRKKVLQRTYSSYQSNVQKIPPSVKNSINRPTTQTTFSVSIFGLVWNLLQTKMKLIHFVSITICISLSIDDSLSQLAVSCDVLYKILSSRADYLLHSNSMCVKSNLRSNALHAFCCSVQVALFKSVALHVSAVATRSSVRTVWNVIQAFIDISRDIYLLTLRVSILIGVSLVHARSCVA